MGYRRDQFQAEPKTQPVRPLNPLTGWLKGFIQREATMAAASKHPSDSVLNILFSERDTSDIGIEAENPPVAPNKKKRTSYATKPNQSHAMPADLLSQPILPTSVDENSTRYEQLLDNNRFLSNSINHLAKQYFSE